MAAATDLGLREERLARVTVVVVLLVGDTSIQLFTILVLVPAFLS